jgi:hypothetical protein
MPDWFYRTCAQPALFCLPDAQARSIALGIIGGLGRNRFGRLIIEFMGHMAPRNELAVSVGGMRLSSRIGLSWRVDPECRATAGLSCFGVGCIERRLGPTPGVKRGAGDCLIETDTLFESTSINVDPCEAPVLLRRTDQAGSETLQLPNGSSLNVVAWDQPIPATTHDDKGVVMQVGTRSASGRWCVPSAMPASLRDRVREWRESLPRGSPLIVTGGVGCPSEAQQLIAAGADLLLVDAGLVFGGPGLVKRCNDALLPSLPTQVKSERDIPIARLASFWMGALGAALIAGGFAALLLAMTRVLLPYDESFLGMSVDVLRRNTPRLFAFMAHDRATLAGTMIGLGWVYLMLARFGGHGAKTAVVASALTGFVSFFAFFGFGYFDTLHAFVAAVLLQFTIQIMVGDDPHRSDPAFVDIEDPAWRRAQWGQLLWVVHALGLLVAGAVILAIGMTSVFVSEDLRFLCVTAQEADAWGSKVKAVVAHDRATLGGMLLASGVAMLLPVLWCFGRRERWLWLAIAGLGVPAYGAAIGIHVAVGYVDWRHMVPALLGMLLWLGGLGLSRSYLDSAQRSQPS